MLNTTTSGFAKKCLQSVFLLFLVGNVSLAKENADAALAKSKHLLEEQLIKTEFEALKTQVEAINRDQLNYKIEKDLLKEAYSSNLQLLNIIIAIVFGVITILSYLGLRSIKEIQGDYRNELDSLKRLKQEFEADLKTLREKLDRVEVELQTQSKTNIDQDRRLRVLEIIEKAGSHIMSMNYVWALEHINIGLSFENNNAVLWHQKSICLSRLARFDEAIEACIQTSKLEPGNLDNIANLLELYAISGDNNKFLELYGAYKSKIDDLYDGYLIVYLKGILAAMRNELSELKEVLKWVKSHGAEYQSPLKDKWNFSEAMLAVMGMLDEKKKSVVKAIIQYFNGENDVSELNSVIAAQYDDVM